MSELHHFTALEQLDHLRRGEITPTELTAHYLKRIARHDELGAFVTVTAAQARARASAVASLSTASALWGLPTADKDLERREGVRTTFGSRAFADFVPDESDESVRARDAAGAISLGKTNTPEFGLSSYTENLVARPALSPYDLSCGAGGSSGGAAVAVAAGLLPFAPGSDGGGSIRIPAAVCGLVGLKPSRGRVPTGAGFGSLAGLVTHGPIARTVADAALLLDAMTEGDYRFATAAPAWDGGAYLNAAIRGEGRFQIGVMTTSPWDSSYDIVISPEAQAALDVATTQLAAIGHGLEALALEADDSYGPNFRTIWQAGAATIAVEGEELELLEPLTRWLIERGRAISARQLGQALAALTQFERSIIRQFSTVDLVLTPSLALTPRPLGWYDSENPERNFEQQCQYTPFTSFVNVSGLPAITLPVHHTAEGVPMGVQLIGRPGAEHTLLAVGAQLQRRIGWERRHPPQW
jgi:amidase